MKLIEYKPELTEEQIVEMRARLFFLILDVILWHILDEYTKPKTKE